MARSKTARDVETLTHDERRTHIPTQEYAPLVHEDDAATIDVAIERRNPDQDPQLVWRGKDTSDWSDLVIQAPPLYIQEKVHPKVLVDDLMRQTEAREDDEDDGQIDLFAQFDGVPDGDAKTEFYQHDANWANRMILGDSLRVMASLAEREGLRGKVQCIYLDPPYGIKFNSNFQWSTTSRDVKDGRMDHLTREPEQVKAFRDTWRDGIHSYLTYLRDRLTVCRDLLTESGSIFVQIGDENVHRVRALMDEVFGENNFISQIVLKTTTGAGSRSGGTATLAGVHDSVLWYAKSSDAVKYRQLFFDKSEMQSADLYRKILMPSGRDRRATPEELDGTTQLPDGAYLFRPDNLTSQSSPLSADFKVSIKGKNIGPGKGRWKTNRTGMDRLNKSNRLYVTNNNSIQYIRKWSDFRVAPYNNVWTDVSTGSFTADKVYVVQTNEKIVTRCVLMATDPGDIVLDPTCGSGTTATVAEQWGRRWITIDTSRVALALARARLMGARYPYYLLKDTREGQRKEAEIQRREPSIAPTSGDVRQGFVYERAPHIMLRDIANATQVDVIWDRFADEMDPIRAEINQRTGLEMEEWQMPRNPGEPWPEAARKQHKRFTRVTTDATRQKAVDRINEILGRAYTIDTLPEHPVDAWEDEALLDLHRRWWDLRIERQREIDASIAAAADFEYLYDRPYEDASKVRVAGPFTVESLAPHRTLGVDADGNVVDRVAEDRSGAGGQDFPSLILEALRKAGVQQAHKEDRIEFESLTAWPGEHVCAVGTYREEATGTDRKAGVFIGPEFGTVARQDLVLAAREAADAGLDALVACAFSYGAHATEFEKLGRVQVLKARMNADLHMATDLADTGGGNLFVIFGEPDVEVFEAEDGDPGQVQVRIRGVDVFDPSTGEVRSDDTDGIACWFVDTDYNEESFFVRHAYFLGAGDPYKALKTTLKAEIDEEAWASLYGDTSRPFDPPSTGRSAGTVINHRGDEVMKVFRVERDA